MNGFQIERRLIYKSDDKVLFLVDEILDKRALPSDGCRLCNFSEESRSKRGIDESKLCIQYIYENILGGTYRSCINSSSKGGPILGIKMAWNINISLFMLSYVKSNTIKGKIKTV